MGFSDITAGHALCVLQSQSFMVFMNSLESRTTGNKNQARIVPEDDSNDWKGKLGSFSWDSLSNCSVSHCNLHELLR